MTQEEFNQVYGGATKNITSNEDIEEQNTRIENSKAELKLEQQKLELQQQQQSFNQNLAIGGFALATLLVIAMIIFLVTKIVRTRKRKI